MTQLDLQQRLEKIEAELVQLKAQETAILNGWKLVPVEPTIEQLISGRKAINGTGKMSHLMQQRLSDIYRAMLAAAPTP